MSRFLVSLIFIFYFTYSFSQDIYSKVQINISKENILALCEFGIDLNDGYFVQDDIFEVILQDRIISELTKQSYSVSVLIEDISSYYQLRNKEQLISQFTSDTNMEWPQPANWELGSMGGYYTYNEILAELDSMYSKYPDLITKRDTILPDTLTHEGRPIYWVKISDNPAIDENEPEVFYNALHHAREPITVMQMIWFMWHLLENYNTDSLCRALINKRELYFVPVVNPDGYVYNGTTHPEGGGMWRKNRRANANGTYGVDLNRNYGFKWGLDNWGSSPNPASETYRGTAAFSEPETQNISSFCQNRNFNIVLNYHSYSDLLIFPWGFTYDLPPDNEIFERYSDLMTDKNKYFYGSGYRIIYPTNGVTDDWMYAGMLNNKKMFSFTPEVGSGSDGFWPEIQRIPELCRECMLLNLRAAQFAGEFAIYKDLTYSTMDENNHLYFSIENLALNDSNNYNLSITPLHNSFTTENTELTFENIDTVDLLIDSVLINLSNADSIETQYAIEFNNGLYSTIDTIQKTFYKTHLLFQEDFNDLENWISDYWRLDTTNLFNENSSVTCDKDFSFNHDVDTSVLLLKPAIDLEKASKAYLQFDALWHIHPFDIVTIEVKETTNNHWEVVSGNHTEKGAPYIIDTQPGYRGIHKWTKEEIDLSAYCGKKINLRFKYFVRSWSMSDEKFSIDKLAIKTLGTGSLLNAVSVQSNFASIYPNPTVNEIHIHTIKNNSSIKIVNLNGTVCLETESAKQTISLNINHIPPGIYFILIQNKQESELLKFVKQ